MKTITIRDHHIPGPYPRVYEPAWDTKAGCFTSIDVAPGFHWRIDERGLLIVYPGWWRRLKRAVTGRW